MDTLTLRQVAVSEPQVAALITTHFELMRAQSPEESCHVLPPEALVGETLFGAFREDQLLGIGALKLLTPEHGEVKSMHTVAHARGQGLARAILLRLIGHARDVGLRRVSLETGTALEFAPARALYAAQGFEACAPFGGYSADPLSAFLTLSV